MGALSGARKRGVGSSRVDPVRAYRRRGIVQLLNARVPAEVCGQSVKWFTWDRSLSRGGMVRLYHLGG